MAIPKGVHVDRLILGQLRFPLLNEYYGSPAQKDDVGEIAREIQRRYLAVVPKRTGKLASTARITYHRTKVHPDRRWEAEFSVGGPAAPYVVQVEAEQHILANVLREMGFFVGDRVDGPEGTIARPHREPPDKREARINTGTIQRGLRTIVIRGKSESEWTPQERAAVKRAERRMGRTSDAELDRIRRAEAEAQVGEHKPEEREIVKAEREVELEASSTRVRAGLYDVSGGGRKFTVEQRLDIPGQPWRASDPGAFHDPHIGDFRTKGEAVEALRDIIKRGGEQ